MGFGTSPQNTQGPANTTTPYETDYMNETMERRAMKGDPRFSNGHSRQETKAPERTHTDSEYYDISATAHRGMREHQQGWWDRLKNRRTTVDDEIKKHLKKIGDANRKFYGETGVNIKGDLAGIAKEFLPGVGIIGSIHDIWNADNTLEHIKYDEHTTVFGVVKEQFDNTFGKDLKEHQKKELKQYEKSLKKEGKSKDEVRQLTAAMESEQEHRYNLMLANMVNMGEEAGSMIMQDSGIDPKNSSDENKIFFDKLAQTMNMHGRDLQQIAKNKDYKFDFEIGVAHQVPITNDFGKTEKVDLQLYNKDDLVRVFNSQYHPKWRMMMPHEAPAMEDAAALERNIINAERKIGITGDDIKSVLDKDPALGEGYIKDIWHSDSHGFLVEANETAQTVATVYGLKEFLWVAHKDVGREESHYRSLQKMGEVFENADIADDIQYRADFLMREAERSGMSAEEAGKRITDTINNLAPGSGITDVFRNDSGMVVAQYRDDAVEGGIGTALVSTHLWRRHKFDKDVLEQVNDNIYDAEITPEQTKTPGQEKEKTRLATETREKIDKLMQQAGMDAAWLAFILFGDEEKREKDAAQLAKGDSEGGDSSGEIRVKFDDGFGEVEMSPQEYIEQGYLSGMSAAALMAVGRRAEEVDEHLHNQRNIAARKEDILYNMDYLTDHGKAISDHEMAVLVTGDENTTGRIAPTLFEVVEQGNMQFARGEDVWSVLVKDDKAYSRVAWGVFKMSTLAEAENKFIALGEQERKQAMTEINRALQDDSDGFGMEGELKYREVERADGAFGHDGKARKTIEFYADVDGKEVSAARYLIPSDAEDVFQLTSQHLANQDNRSQHMQDLVERLAALPEESISDAELQEKLGLKLEKGQSVNLDELRDIRMDAQQLEELNHFATSREAEYLLGKIAEKDGDDKAAEVLKKSAEHVSFVNPLNPEERDKLEFSDGKVFKTEGKDAEKKMHISNMMIAQVAVIKENAERVARDMGVELPESGRDRIIDLDPAKRELLDDIKELKEEGHKFNYDRLRNVTGLQSLNEQNLEPFIEKGLLPLGDTDEEKKRNMVRIQEYVDQRIAENKNIEKSEEKSAEKDKPLTRQEQEMQNIVDGLRDLGLDADNNDLASRNNGLLPRKNGHDKHNHDHSSRSPAPRH